MSRVALFLARLVSPCSSAVAHPGHDAAEPHLHAIWEIVLLVAVIAVFVVIRIRPPSSLRRERKHSRLPLCLSPSDRGNSFGSPAVINRSQSTHRVKLLATRLRPRFFAPEFGVTA